MNWEAFLDEALCIDDRYMDTMGALVGVASEHEVLDAYAMLFGYSL